MQFFPGQNSPIDVGAGGWANYDEKIPALYSNYVFENEKFELEGGLRVEYVKVDYQVNPNHNTYKSDGYRYFQPFPNLRAAYKLNERNKISLFFNRRVDRPNEVDIRIFPKYDEPELVKVGNPALQPQFATAALQHGRAGLPAPIEAQPAAVKLNAAVATAAQIIRMVCSCKNSGPTIQPLR
jgi:outer membrane receptor protein involved in Fe transport